MPHPDAESLRPSRIGGQCLRPTVAIVLLKPHETREQAWQRHLQKNPQDQGVDVRIFHIDHQGIS